MFLIYSFFIEANSWLKWFQYANHKVLINYILPSVHSSIIECCLKRAASFFLFFCVCGFWACLCFVLFLLLQIWGVRCFDFKLGFATCNTATNMMVVLVGCFLNVSIDMFVGCLLFVLTFPLGTLCVLCFYGASFAGRILMFFVVSGLVCVLCCLSSLL